MECVWHIIYKSINYYKSMIYQRFIIFIIYDNVTFNFYKQNGHFYKAPSLPRVFFFCVFVNNVVTR